MLRPTEQQLSGKDCGTFTYRTKAQNYSFGLISLIFCQDHLKFLLIFLRQQILIS